jgi:hypothetical protein
MLQHARAAADHEPGGGLLGHRSRERGAAYHLRTRYAELIGSPGLARLLMRSLPMSLQASFCRQNERARGKPITNVV